MRPNLSLWADDQPSTSESAVQGELFAVDDEDETCRGYRGTVASKVAGITYRQLDYWARKQILEPSITPSHGSGSRRLYSFKDVLILAVSKRLLDAGVNLQNVTAAIGFLSRRSTRRLENVTIMCDGQHVHECVTSDEMVELLRTGKAVFAISVGSLWHQVHDTLEGEDYVDLRLHPAQASAGRPIDDLTAERLRRKLRVQQARRAEGRG
ncbi:MerR family transcriptional regulator [Bifidobacterium sp. CP2]|uniref:MerR family transcriptional regulator n=1 Tax=Bifidobacterium sp. CP2 TaxID=2809025 RepID=UPI001BDC736C|nr:MerR family transcriptional regulator [Bifidobacterium sp. CP2]MBT1181218.1 MerR family transcriptional regulator [Bifidobacterium sp. CP2]